MGNIASINFKKTTTWQLKHNIDIRPSYAIGGKLEFNRNSKDAEILKNQIIKQAKDTYERTKKPKAPAFKAKSYEWSAVVNLKPDSTMQDLENLSAHFSDKYGFQCYQIAIHRDEGHINELGEKVINHHAHLEFITLDRETGKNRFRGVFVTPKNFRAIQSEVAEILQMERGQDKRLTNRKRIEPRKYAQIKEQEKKNAKELKNNIENLKGNNTQLEQANTYLKQENDFLKGENEQLLAPKEIKELLESFRKQCIGKGLPKEFFRDLSAQKQNPKQSTKQELEIFCEDLLRAYKQKELNAKSALIELIGENTKNEAKAEKEREERIKAEQSLSELRTTNNRAIEQMRQMQLRIDELELELKKEREERIKAESKNAELEAKKRIENIDNLIDKVEQADKEHKQRMQRITPREAEIQAMKERIKESTKQIHKKRNDWGFER